MAPAHTPNLIDGFSSVRAVRHSKQKRTDRPEQEKPAAPAAKPPVRTGPSSPRAARIGHTAMPRRFEIVCYQCGYDFTMTGHLYNTVCPKCHESLEVGNHEIDAPWQGNLKTIGTVNISEAAVLSEATIVAGDVIVAGDIREARMTVCRTLELCPGARINPARINMKDVRVMAGARVSTRRKVSCRNLDIYGQLNARVFADGLITVHAGGCLSGEVHGAHLVVEDCGGLKAEMTIAPGK